MRGSIKDFVKICIETLPLKEPVYEFGSLQVPEQEGYADMRPFFPGKKYVGIDKREGVGVDLRRDIQRTGLDPNIAGTLLCLDTLEYVEYPRKVIAEAKNILFGNGFLIVSSHLDSSIRGYPYDYWRFTPAGMQSLLNIFHSTWVGKAGRGDFSHTIIGIASQSTITNETRNMLRARTTLLKEYWKGFTIPSNFQ